MGNPAPATEDGVVEDLIEIYVDSEIERSEENITLTLLGT